jgi:hypothetical protein
LRRLKIRNATKIEVYFFCDVPGGRAPLILRGLFFGGAGRFLRQARLIVPISPNA